jgi:hypothetical protein
MKLTKKKAVKMFRAHWRWLAETGSRHKEFWPGHDFAEDGIDSTCFLCEYMDQVDGDCRDCPIEWPGINCADKNHEDEKGLFSKWWSAATRRTRREYARIISKLPEREDKNGSNNNV